MCVCVCICMCTRTFMKKNICMYENAFSFVCMSIYEYMCMK